MYRLEPRFTRYGPFPVRTPWGRFRRFHYIDPASHDLDNPDEPEYHDGEDSFAVSYR